MIKNRLRVVMIIQTYLPYFGGAERQLAALCPLLRRRGIDPFILTRRYAGLKAFEIIDGTPVYRLPVPGPKPLAAISFVFTAQFYIARLRPDVTHAYELLSPASAALIARRFFGVPVVAKVLRGGHEGDIDRLRRRSFGGKRLAYLSKQIDAFIVISNEIEAELAQIGTPAERRYFIPNGVDLGRFMSLPMSQKELLRDQLGLPRSAQIVVFSGRLVAEKRIDLLLKVWDEIKKERPNVLLMIIGTGNQETNLRHLAGDHVRFLGQLDDVTSYLQTSDLFVLPSATEGLSNSLLEALSVGLPCVVTSVGGSPDVIVHGYNGLLVPPDDHQALYTALLATLSDADLRNRLGIAARETIQARYSLESTADRLSELYACLAQGEML